MFIDIAVPKNNELELIRMAERLSIGGICFLYSCSEKEMFENKKNKIKELSNKTSLKIFLGLLSDEENFSKEKSISKVIALKPGLDYRKIIEKNRQIIIYGIETLEKKESLHQRNSGLNHIICNIIKKNEITLAFSLNSLLSLEPKRRVMVMGRIVQNIKLCRKYKINPIIASFAENRFGLRTKHDIKNFFVTLGMHPSEAEESLNLLSEKLKYVTGNARGGA